MFTKKELVEELWREIQIREKFYPIWVRGGKIKQVEADRRLALMRAAYQALMQTPENIISGLRQHL